MLWGFSGECLTGEFGVEGNCFSAVVGGFGSGDGLCL